MTTTDFTAVVEEEELFVRRQAIEAIEALYNVRAAKHAYENEEKAARMVIDAYFQSHPDEREIFDEEKGYKVWLKPGGESEVYDTVLAIKGRNKPLYKRLKELGAVSEALDTDKVKEAIKNGLLMPVDIDGFRHKKERTPSLMVERTK